MRSKIGAGMVAGLIAGVVFGLLMHAITVPPPMNGSMPMMTDGREPMMSMMARVVRSESLVAGWIYLLVNSVVMGGIFGLVLGEGAARIVGESCGSSLRDRSLVSRGADANAAAPRDGAVCPSDDGVDAARHSGESGSAHRVRSLVLGGFFASLYRGQGAAQPEGGV